MSNKKAPSPAMVFIAFVILYIVWGSTYFFIQKAETGFPALTLGALRFVIGGILMLLWSLARGENIFIKSDIKHAAVSGILMLFLGNGAVIWVEQYLPSGLVAILVSSSPLWFVVLDKRNWNINFRSPATIIGLIIGFAGVIILFIEKVIAVFSVKGNGIEIINFGLLIMGSMAWAAGSLYSKYKGARVSALTNSGWQLLAAGLAFIPGSFFRGEIQNMQWQSITGGAWFSLFYLIFFGSIAGFSAYVWLLQVRSATLVSTHAYVNPVVAVLLGVFFAGEYISLLQMVGLIVILGSVLMINIVRYRQNINSSAKETVTRTDTEVC